MEPRQSIQDINMNMQPPMVDLSEEFVVVGSRADVTKSLPDTEDLVIFEDVSVRQILSNKPSNNVVTSSPNDTVYEAISKMAELKVGALVVTEAHKPIGIISERDYMTKIALKGLSSKKVHVKDIMTKNIRTISPDIGASECMKMMTNGRFRHIPVVDENQTMLGIISIGDLVKYVMDQQKDTIHYLKQYIERTY